jgi:hypothetical protein
LIKEQGRYMEYGKDRGGKVKIEWNKNKEWSTRSKVKHGNKGKIVKHKCKHKWQMKDKKKMVDGDVFISVMAFSLHQ